MDSVISWFIVTAFSLYGIARFLLLVVEENERKLEESERAWSEWN